MCYRTDEGSRRKCGQYWPLEEGGQEVYGHMAVVNQRVDHHTHYSHTTLELHNTEVRLWSTTRICIATAGCIGGILFKLQKYSIFKHAIWGKWQSVIGTQNHRCFSMEENDYGKIDFSLFMWVIWKQAKHCSPHFLLPPDSAGKLFLGRVL